MDVPLLETEKRVLYGLVEYPQLTDRELSKVIGLKLPTVTAVRLKLQRRGFVETRRIPALDLLGCEMVSASTVTFSAHPPLERKIREANRVLNNDEFVYTLSEPNQDFLLQVGRNLTEVRRNVEEIEIALKRIGVLERHVTRTDFPFGLTEVPRFFEYGDLLARAFWPDRHSPVPAPKPVPPGTPRGGSRLDDLGRKDREVLLGLVQYPDLTDLELADQIPVSRMTIGKTKRRLRETGLLRDAVIPNLQRIGFELLVVTAGSFSLALMEGLKAYVPDLLRGIGPHIFVAYGRSDLLAISVFRDFAEYKRSTQEFTEKYRLNELFAEPPTNLIFSLNSVVMPKNHAYAGIVAKCVGIRDVRRSPKARDLLAQQPPPGGLKPPPASGGSAGRG